MKATTISKSAAVAMFGDHAQKCAQKICGRGDCISSFPCGHSNKAAGIGKPLNPQSTTCPLAKYNIQPEQDPKAWWECSYTELYATQDELFAACACCDNTDVTEKGDEYVTRRHDLMLCCDCPVKMVEDAMDEAAAEAAMS